MKNVLVVYYSQSGQLTDTVRSIAAPLEADPQIQVHYECLKPQQDYPFPWPLRRFLDTFPESVYLDAPAMQPLGVDPHTRFDLIILAYQVWFLSPSLPITGFVKSAQGRQLLAQTPVITVTACRNMWLKAQEKLLAMLSDAGARHLDHVALVDQSSALASFFTTPYWVLSGRKKGFWGFPDPGVAREQIAAASRFGRAIAAALHTGDLLEQAPLLRGLEAVKVDERLIPGETIAHRSFLIWGGLLRKLGPQGSPLRAPVLAIYALFLIAMIALVVLPVMPLRALARRLNRRRIEAQKAAYEQPSGSESFRMREFAE